MGYCNRFFEIVITLHAKLIFGKHEAHKACAMPSACRMRCTRAHERHMLSLGHLARAALDACYWAWDALVQKVCTHWYVLRSIQIHAPQYTPVGVLLDCPCLDGAHVSGMHAHSQAWDALIQKEHSAASKRTLLGGTRAPRHGISLSGSLALLVACYVALRCILLSACPYLHFWLHVPRRRALLGMRSLVPMHLLLGAHPPGALLGALSQTRAFGTLVSIDCFIFQCMQNPLPSF